MKTRDGHEIKKGYVYYWVNNLPGDHYIYKIRCRSFEKLSGCLGITNRYYPNRTVIMVGTDDQDFTAPETRRFVFKSSELAKKYCLHKYRLELGRIKNRIVEISNMNLTRMGIIQ